MAAMLSASCSNASFEAEEPAVLLGYLPADGCEALTVDLQASEESLQDYRYEFSVEAPPACLQNLRSKAVSEGWQHMPDNGQCGNALCRDVGNDTMLSLAIASDERSAIWIRDKF